MYPRSGSRSSRTAPGPKRGRRRGARRRLDRHRPDGARRRPRPRLGTRRISCSAPPESCFAPPDSCSADADSSPEHDGGLGWLSHSGGHGSEATGPAGALSADLNGAVRHRPCAVAHATAARAATRPPPTKAPAGGSPRRQAPSHAVTGTIRPQIDFMNATGDGCRHAALPPYGSDSSPCNLPKRLPRTRASGGDGAHFPSGSRASYRLESRSGCDEQALDLHRKAGRLLAESAWSCAGEQGGVLAVSTRTGPVVTPRHNGARSD